MLKQFCLTALGNCMLWFEITTMLIAVQKIIFTVSLIIIFGTFSFTIQNLRGAGQHGGC